MTKSDRFELLSLRNAVSIIGLFCAGWLLSGCYDDTGGSEESIGPMIPAVEAVQARYGSLPLTQRLSGGVRAKNQVAIYPEISAVITEVLVSNGEAVREGQPLVKLRDRDLRERLKQARASYQITVAQLRQAEAQLKEVEAELKRVESLAEKDLTSTAELETVQTRVISASADVDLAKARLEQAEATVDEQEENLSRTVIKAPVAGSVGNRNAEVGMLVTPNARLFTLGQLDNVRVEVVLTDRMLDYIKEGQRSEILASGLTAGPASAPLSRISPFLHPVTHSTEAEIDLENPEGQLKPGMFVTVDIFYGESEHATLVPLSALYEHPTKGGTGVYVSRAPLDRETTGSAGGKDTVPLTEPVGFEFVPVEVVAQGRMEAGVRGVEEGDWVVTLGQNLLSRDSSSARVRPVKWEWVEKLQNLQKEDLMKEVIERHAPRPDTTSGMQDHSSM